MTELAAAPVMVGLPEPVGRRARLGPFPSGREAVKFASYAALGAVVAGATNPLLWLPFLGVGFLFAIVRHEGQGLDAHLLSYVRFRLRSGRSRGGSGGSSTVPCRGAVARTDPGRYLAVLSTGGIPIAFLPSPEARSIFEGFRALLRAHEGGLYFRMGLRRVAAAPLLPGRSDRGPDSERVARDGYRELVLVLARNRQRRSVEIVTWVEADGAGSVARLEELVQSLSGRLLALGLVPERLRDSALGEALEGIGWGGSPA